MPLGVAFVRETTVFREYGPLVGRHDAPRLRDRATDWRRSSRGRRSTSTRATTCGSRTNGVLAFAVRGFQSWGDFPNYLYFGGNSELRGYEYLEFLGRTAFFANAELRFPLIEAALTPIGVVGGLRGVAFFNFGGAGPFNRSIQVWTKDPTQAAQIIGFVPDPNSLQGASPVYGPVQDINGFRLVDSRASYGIGLETFALGFPIHFDWSWRTLFNKDWEDIVYDYQALADGDPSGSHWLRKAEILGLDWLRLLDSTRPKRRGFRRTHGWVRLRFRCQATGGLSGTAAATRASAGAGSTPAALPSLRDAAPNLPTDRVTPPVAP